MTIAESPPMPSGAWPRHIDGRTFQKVRRESHPYESGEQFFRPVTKGLVTRIQRAAERLAKVSMWSRKPGVRRGELTDIDLQILECLLFKAMHWKSGRLDWTYQQIGKFTGRARDTIARSLEALERVGILERMRRFTVTEVDGKGPQVHQAANAYRVKLPARLASLLGIRAPVVPDDHEIAARDGRLSNDLYLSEITGKPTLGSALAKLRIGVDQRESRK